MKTVFYLFFATSVFALQHAYLEALIHKAYDPIFGNVFLQEFIAENDFTTDRLGERDLNKWSRRVPSKYSAWLTKLEVKSFELLLLNISFVVNSWKDVIDAGAFIEHPDVVEECAIRCMQVCDLRYRRSSQKERADQASLNEAFLDWVFKVQLAITSIPHFNQARYFELLNKASEHMERTSMEYIRFDQVNPALSNYERVSGLAAKMVSTKFNVAIDPLATSNPTNFQLAKEALRIVNSARFISLHSFGTYSEDVEEAMIGICDYLNTFSTSSLIHWAKGKAKTIIQDTLSLNIFPTSVSSIERSSRRISVESCFPLPLSILQENKKAASNMTYDEVVNILDACKMYRRVARLIDDICHKRTYQVPDKQQIFNAFLSQLHFIKLPPNVSELFNMHIRIMSYALEYLPNLVHFSNIPVSEKASIGMERDYLQKITHWINAITIVVPEAKRRAHFQLMFEFIALEVKCLIPEDQRELVMMTLILMIDGGLRAYYNK